MSQGFDQFVKLAGAHWPGKALDVQPGDLSLFAPMGNGLGMPMIVMPGDDFESIANRKDFYQFRPHNGHPFSGAPLTEATGGTVFFDDDCDQSDFLATLRLMEVDQNHKDFAAFLQVSSEVQEGYLTQLRLVSGSALSLLYGIGGEPESTSLRAQALSIGEALWKFVEWHRDEHRAGRYNVDGAWEADGDWSYESLAFGFMVENAYHSIYRIWTRAWVITK